MLKEAINATFTIDNNISLLFNGNISISTTSSVNPCSVNFLLYKVGGGYVKSVERAFSNWGRMEHTILPFTVLFNDVTPGNYKFVIGAGSSWTTDCRTDPNDFVTAFYEILPPPNTLMGRTIIPIWEKQSLNTDSLLNEGILAPNIIVPSSVNSASLVFNGHITVSCKASSTYTLTFRLSPSTGGSFDSTMERTYANYDGESHVLSPFMVMFENIKPGNYKLVIGASPTKFPAVSFTNPDDYLSMYYEMIPTPKTALMASRNLFNIWNNAILSDGSAIYKNNGIFTTIDVPSSILSTASLIFTGTISIRCVQSSVFTIKFRLYIDGVYNGWYERTYAVWRGNKHVICPFTIVFPNVTPGTYKLAISAPQPEDPGYADKIKQWNNGQCNTDGADALTAFYEIAPNLINSIYIT